jgi:DNA-binding NarL/FixJ family response regulator
MVCEGEIEEPGEPSRSRPRPHRPYELELTQRELDVLRLIAAGGTNKDVAAALGIRPKTVMHHSVAIYRKLGVRGRAEATAYAYRNGLIDEHQPTSS